MARTRCLLQDGHPLECSAKRPYRVRIVMGMTFALVVSTDGRKECLEQSMKSIEYYLPPVDHKIIVNDSGDPEYSAWLDKSFPDFTCIHHSERLGLAGATRSAFQAAIDTGADYYFRMEDDFILQETVDLQTMGSLLSHFIDLAQIAFKRQPVNEVERQAGGFIETDPGRYWEANGLVQHQVCFTFNPSLIPRRVAQLCLDQPGDGLERGFTDTLVGHTQRPYSFGIFGTIDDPPRVIHIGETRSQGWKA